MSQLLTSRRRDVCVYGCTSHQNNINTNNKHTTLRRNGRLSYTVAKLARKSDLATTLTTYLAPERVAASQQIACWELLWPSRDASCVRFMRRWVTEWHSNTTRPTGLAQYVANTRVPLEEKSERNQKIYTFNHVSSSAASKITRKSFNRIPHQIAACERFKNSIIIRSWKNLEKAKRIDGFRGKLVCHDDVTHLLFSCENSRDRELLEI